MLTPANRRFLLFLAPIPLHGVVAFAMVPVTTYVLGPADFGMFAVITALTAFAGTVAALGAGYLLAAHFPILSELERRNLISSIVLVGTGLMLLCSGAVWVVWTTLAGGRPDWGTPAFVALSLVAVALTFPWTIAMELLVLQGRAGVYSAVLLGQTAAATVTTVVCLYVLKLGVASLFLAAAASGLVACVGALIVLGKYLRPRMSAPWVRSIFRLGPPIALGTFSENLYTFAERFILGRFVGVSAVGLLTHSMQYRAFVALAVKAGARTVWPTSLEEARQPDSRFPNTYSVWTISHVAITAVGLVFATHGQWIVSTLTHDKFTPAYPLIAVWMVFLLVQHSGKPQTAVMYAANYGSQLANIIAWSGLAGVLLLLLLVPIFGIWGPVYVAILQQLAIRLSIRWFLVRRQRVLPFQDRWVLIGAAAIIASLLVSRVFSLTPVGNSLLLSASLLALLLTARGMLAPVTVHPGNLIRYHWNRQ